MDLINVDFKELGYILLTQGIQSADLTDPYVKYMEWAKRDQKISLDERIIIRLYKSNNKVIIYKGGSAEYFRVPAILFNGRIDSIETLEFVYSLVKD